MGDANAVIVHTADAARLPYPDGSRGYRYANIDAGMAGERGYTDAEVTFTGGIARQRMAGSPHLGQWFGAGRSVPQRWQRSISSVRW